jgi:hypothetical protein
MECGGFMQMKELVERIVRALVDFTEEVHVREIEATNMKILEIKVAKQDVGKLIGRKGKNIMALRKIVAAAGKGERYMVEVVRGDRERQGNHYPPNDHNQGTGQISNGEETNRQE